VAPPLLDDIFFGVPITQKIKNAYNGLKSKVSKGLSYFKGVSAGGEEFTHKLDKLLAAANASAKRPEFHHGTLRQVVDKLSGSRPFLLYLSGGDDQISKQFETFVLTQDEIITTMVSYY